MTLKSGSKVTQGNGVTSITQLRNCVMKKFCQTLFCLRFAQIVFLDPQNAPKSLAAGATGGAYSAPRAPLAGLMGPTSKGRGEGREFYCVIVLEG